MDIAFELRREMNDAQALLATYHDIVGDDEARADMVEGESSLKDVIGSAVARVAELETQMAAIDGMITRLKARDARLMKQADTLRTLIVSAMEIGAIKRLDLPMATVTLKPTGPQVRITDEAQIPHRFWKIGTPSLDRRGLLTALKSDDPIPIPGAELSNGGMTVAIKFT
jgi:hypothetical protein